MSVVPTLSMPVQRAARAKPLKRKASTPPPSSSSPPRRTWFELEDGYVVCGLCVAYDGLYRPAPPLPAVTHSDAPVRLRFVPTDDVSSLVRQMLQRVYPAYHQDDADVVSSQPRPDLSFDHDVSRTIVDLAKVCLRNVCSRLPAPYASSEGYARLAYRLLCGFIVSRALTFHAGWWPSECAAAEQQADFLTRCVWPAARALGYCTEPGGQDVCDTFHEEVFGLGSSPINPFDRVTRDEMPTLNLSALDSTPAMLKTALFDQPSIFPQPSGQRRRARDIDMRDMRWAMRTVALAELGLDESTFFFTRSHQNEARGQPWFDVIEELRRVAVLRRMAETRDTSLGRYLGFPYDEAEGFAPEPLPPWAVANLPPIQL